MRDKVHDIDVRKVDAKTVCEVRLSLSATKFCAILLKYTLCYIKTFIILYFTALSFEFMYSKVFCCPHFI